MVAKVLTDLMPSWTKREEKKKKIQDFEKRTQELGFS